MRAALRSFCFVMGCAAVCFAQPLGRGPSSRPRSDDAVSPEPPRISLQSHLALSVALRLLGSESSDDRVRGVLRLGASGQPEAIDRLVHAFDSGSPIARDPRARLTGIRVLAPYATRNAVRDLLAKVLASEPGMAPLASLLQSTAAMALAASDDPHSAKELVNALHQGGSVADAAEVALLAHPPRSLAPFGAGREGQSARVCQLFGRLGDVRAISLLRATLVRGLLRDAVTVDADDEEPPAVASEEESQQARVAAAMALARLGDQEQVAVARSWVSSGDSERKLAGAEILLLSDAPDARGALVLLLGSAATRGPALALATRAGGPLLLPVLSSLAKQPSDSNTLAISTRLAIEALGRLAGKGAVSVLSSLIQDPVRAWDAAFALSRAAGDDARVALELAPSPPSSAALRRLLARAGVLRALTLRDPPGGLIDRLRVFLESSDASDRAVGAFGLVALGKADARDLLTSRDPFIARAVARASFVAGADAARACGERLRVEPDPTTRIALALALAASTESFATLSTEQLASWAESDEPLAPLSVVALGPRELPSDERRLGRFLESDDPVLRRHAAFALALSPVPDAASRLADAWRFEADPSVRRAIMIALAQRTEPQRAEVLTMAEALDPDAQVREAARLGTRGQLPFPLGRFGAGCAGGSATVGTCYAARISAVPSSLAASKDVGGQPGRIFDPSGLVLPVVTDPDGVLLVPGVSGGSWSFRLASSSGRYEALAHDAAQGPR